jgi:flagellar protein FliL
MADQSSDLKTPKEEKENKEAQKNKKGGKKLYLIVGGLVIVLVVVGVTLLLGPKLLPGLFGQKTPAKEAKEEKPKKAGSVLGIEPFVVNLADTDSIRYLKVKMEIESQEQVTKEEFEKNLPQLRDAILAILTSKTFKDIFDLEGKKKLKEEIVLKANQLSAHYKVKTVYFTEFVIQ